MSTPETHEEFCPACLKDEVQNVRAALHIWSAESVRDGLLFNTDDMPDIWAALPVTGTS